MCEIPRFGGSPKPWSRVGDSDAAGGSRETTVGAGLGVVVGKKWAYLPWARFINDGKKCEYCGKNWAQKLTFLEYCGHLARILIDVPDCIGHPIITRIDNAGCYFVDKKGYHLKCELLDYLVRVTHFVATALAVEARIVKIRRCSTPGAIAADLISKANFASLDAVFPERNIEPTVLSKAFRIWLQNPKVDSGLEMDIVKEFQVLGYRLFINA